MFHGIQLLRTGDIAASADSLTVAVKEAAERYPTYLGQNTDTAIAVTLHKGVPDECEIVAVAT